MKRKRIPQRQHPPSKGKKFSPILLVLICAIISICGSIVAIPTTYAAGVPGGNIADPVVRAVDIAKPAVVRIVTTIGGRLTVTFPDTSTATFPRDGGNYKIQGTGSGAFISSHGDILTAEHVIRPSHDSSLDYALYNKAAQDVADYINSNFRPTTSWTAEDVFGALITETFHSSSQYTDPTSRIYLSTDYTGPIDASKLEDMPKGTYADVDRILAAEKGLLNGDTAIIHVDLEDTPSIQLGDSSAVASQDELIIIGFPSNGDLNIDNNGKSTHPNPSTGFFTSSLNKLDVSAIKQTKNGAPLIQIGGNVEHGDSGGPALDRNGNIVGVASFVGTEMPSGTGFLQASETAQDMIKDLKIDTKPGAFQKAWRQAFKAYASTEPGHWHEAQMLFKQLQKKYAKNSDQTEYPNFRAVKPFLDYATKQADNEIVETEVKFPLQTIVFIVVIILALAVVVFMLLLLRRKPRVAISSLPSGYQPVQSENPLSPDFQQVSQSGQISPSELVLLHAHTVVDGAPAQGSASSSLPAVPQTPTPIPPVTPAVISSSLISSSTPVVDQQSQPPVYSPLPPYPQNPQQAWPPVTPQPSYPGYQPYSPVEQKLPPLVQQVAPTLVSSPPPTPPLDDATIKVSPEMLKQITSGSIPVQPKEVVELSQTPNQDDDSTLPSIEKTQAENKKD
jgi:S1-C subfamily serine protease